MTIKTKYLALLAAVLLLPASAYAQTIAHFLVYKYYDDSQAGSDFADYGVDVKIVCTSGNDPTQTTTITKNQNGDFQIENLPDNTHDCTVTETDGPAGFSPDYEASCNSGGCAGSGYLDSDNDFDGCKFTNVQKSGSVYKCAITNFTDPAFITIDKTWVLENTSFDDFNGAYDIKLECETDVFECNDSSCDSGTNHSNNKASIKNINGDETLYFKLPHPDYPSDDCTIEEKIKDSVVEVTFGEGCGELQNQSKPSKKKSEITVESGDDVTCNITNTVFFEGIPTLNHYGMAILALLMLGVGFVGFRRFV